MEGAAMPREESDSVKLARIDVRTLNTDARLAEHVKRDEDVTERLFHYIKEQFQGINDRFDTVDARLGTLWDDKNKRDGAKDNSSKMGAVGSTILNTFIAAVTAWATIKLIK